MGKLKRLLIQDLNDKRTMSGSTVGLQWVYSGSTVGLQWVYSGSTVALQRTKDEQKTNNERR